MALRESRKKFRLSLNILWEPGSEVPCEYVTLRVDKENHENNQLHDSFKIYYPTLGEV